MTAFDSAPSARPWAEETTKRGERRWPALLISTFALGVSAISVLISIQQSSGEYRVKQEISRDIASLISTLQSIMLKVELDSEIVSLDYEVEQLNKFLNSSTLLFVASYYCKSNGSVFGLNWYDFVSHIRDVVKYYEEKDWTQVHNKSNVLWNRLLLLDKNDVEEIKQAVSSYPRYLKCVARELYGDFFLQRSERL